MSDRSGDTQQAREAAETLEIMLSWVPFSQRAEVRQAFDDLVAECDRYETALQRVAGQQQRTLGWLEANGIVFDGPLGTDPKNWQHVAFSIYNDLCEVDMWARQALAEKGE